MTRFELFAFWAAYVLSECVSECDQAREQRAEGFKEIFNDLQMQCANDPKAVLCELLSIDDLISGENETLYDFIRRMIFGQM